MITAGGSSLATHGRDIRRAVSLIASFLSCLATSSGAILPLRTYTIGDGLADNHVQCIVRDSRGFLWLCTDAGLSQFDGHRFRNFGEEAGLPPGRVNLLLETRRGEYWVASQGGLFRMDPAAPGRFIAYVPEDPKARATYSIAEDSDGSIWCDTRAGIYHLERTSGQWKFRFVDIGMPRENPDPTATEALLVDRKGDLWVASSSGLYRRFADGRYEHYTTRDGLPHIHAMTLLQDRAGRLWAGTWGGLCRIATHRKPSGPLVEKLYTNRSGLAGNVITALFQSSDGQIWVGTGDGLSKYVVRDGREEFDNFTADNGLSGNQIWSIGQDQAENLWLGAFGAMKMTRGGFVSYSTKDGLADNFCISIGEDRSDALYVLTTPSFHSATNMITFNVFDGHRFHPVHPNTPHGVGYWDWPFYQIALQDHLKEWWISTNKGVLRFPAVSSIQELAHVRPKALYNSRDQFAGDGITRIFEDSRGDIWIGTAGPTKYGLTRWERATNTMKRYPDMESESFSRRVSAFVEDRSGNVWIGFRMGDLARYRNGRFDMYPGAGGSGASAFAALYQDSAGRIWGAGMAGVIRIDAPESNAPRFITYTKEQGLASREGNSVTEDRFGRIYIGTPRTLDSFYPQFPFRFRHYSENDGIGGQGAGISYRDHEGTLWFFTEKGLSRLEKLEPERQKSCPTVLIRDLRIRGVNRPISVLGETRLTGLELQADQNQLQVEFGALNFSTADVTRYQYRLERADSDWSPPSAERTVNFASIAPGSYQFSVRAVASDGQVDNTPSTIAFTILPPVWDRWWFRVLAVTSSGLLLSVLYRYRVKHLLEMQRLRTRIASDLHDDIGSTLSQIAILSEVASRGKSGNAGAPLSDIANLSREAVDSMSDIVWVNDPDRDTLHDLIHRVRRFAADLFDSAGIHVQFRVHGDPESVNASAEARRQTYLICKEALNNTCRHSSCTKVEVNFEIGRSRLEVEINDNGKGFDPRARSDGHGLRSMEWRAQQAAGRIRINSAHNGTSVQVSVPVRTGFKARSQRILHKWIGKPLSLKGNVKK
jgi:ligand-binding sensor domain-containing protein/signal transduction histidine kinase